MVLSGFDVENFLRDIWQKQPLLIRNPWPAWHNPLAPDELAGLACEEGVESRLIVQEAETWKVEHGPIAPERFGHLGGRPWTLLVQAVDHHVPEVAAVLDAFRFIPNWRIDDVMVSYANDQGGVGPHFDQYDVFLIQGLGRRRWRIGAMCDHASELLPHDELRLIADFSATDEWVLEPGDILYLPPRIAHDGVALGDDCMTYSIGFRAPSRRELVEAWCEHVVAGLHEDDRFTDPAIRPDGNPGEISAEALDKLDGMIAEALSDRTAFARWFGSYASRPKNSDIEWAPEEPVEHDELRALLAQRTPLARNPASRFSFIRTGGDTVLLFVDGQSFECAHETARIAEDLCARSCLTLAPELAGVDAAVQLIARLIDQGSAAFEGADDESSR